MTVINEIKKLEKAFDLFNKEFYNNELPRPVIQFYADQSESAYGWISIREVWDDGWKAQREINISANFADREKENIYATLLHEMAHLYNMENKILDTSSGGFYHNKKFKETAENHGLIIKRDPRYGWTITQPNEKTKELCEQLEKITMKHLRERNLPLDGDEAEEGKKEKKQNSFKHACPRCGAIARTSKPTVKLVCGDCMEPMEMQE